MILYKKIMRGRQGKGSKEMRGGRKQQGGSRGGLKGKQGHQEKGELDGRILHPVPHL